MNDALPVTPEDLESIRMLIQRMGEHTSIVDFEEQVLISSVRVTMRAWKQDRSVIGFAFVDDYNNLWFEAESDSTLEYLAGEMIAWGMKCLRLRSSCEGDAPGLDTVCSAENVHRVGLLQKHGFTMLRERTLRFSRSLLPPLEMIPLPEGFHLRPARGVVELDDLVALHRAAFGTDAMTAEQRLAILHAPGYLPDLDLVAVAPDGRLAVFCICGFDDPDRMVGYTDPVGTHPRYQNMGLGKAVVSAGMEKLKNLGARVVELGTSSENIAMQRLARSLGFTCIAEKIWFTKPVL